jgi:membrane protease YdiL (CAAX protease family)
MSTFQQKLLIASRGTVRTEPRKGYREWIARHPVAAFVVGAYGFTWFWWTPSMLGFEGALVSLAMFVGAFGPAISGATMIRLGNGSARGWMRAQFRWRVPLRWYAFALGLPVLIVSVTSAAFVLGGGDLEFSLLGGNLAMLVPLLLFVTLLGGGNEEPGWRGFALPRLQRRWAPVRATLLLGAVWALWHVPILIAAGGHGLNPLPFALIIIALFVGIAGGYAFPLTFLYNRTQSTFLCMLLHGAYNTAIGLLILVPEDALRGATYAGVTVAITGTMLAVTAVLLVVTRGRLGLDAGANAQTIAVGR